VLASNLDKDSIIRELHLQLNYESQQLEAVGVGDAGCGMQDAGLRFRGYIYMERSGVQFSSISEALSHCLHLSAYIAIFLHASVHAQLRMSEDSFEHASTHLEDSMSEDSFDGSHDYLTICPHACMSQQQHSFN
jgi:hypothetical protein